MNACLLYGRNGDPVGNIQTRGIIFSVNTIYARICMLMALTLPVYAATYTITVHDGAELHTVDEHFDGINFVAFWQTTYDSPRTKATFNQMNLGLVRFPGDVPCQWYDWELAYFSGPTNANPSALASNGVNTVRECYIAGLDPNGATVFFDVSGFSVQASGQALAWSTATGRTYSVFRSSNLLSSVWSFVGTTTNGTYMDDHASPFGAYRLGVEIAP